MATASSTIIEDSYLLQQDDAQLFPLRYWAAELPELAGKYQTALPVPHIYIPALLNPAGAVAAATEFPASSTSTWTHYQHQNENKHGMTKRQLFPAGLGEVCDALNTPAFVQWLSVLTGIPGLMADPSLEGGGLHQSGRGGFLNVHTDFSHHHYNADWKRRINLIVYFNEDWKEEWGGALELWDSAMRSCVAKYPPLLNSAIIFNTDEHSYHGFPEPLQCPELSTRKSLALYYYTIDRGAKAAKRSTNYRARPEDSLLKSVMIWLDKKAVHYYSQAKAKFGFSDDLASRILDKFSHKK